MKSQKGMTSKMIAPCGINCATCLAYMRERKPCPGCRGDEPNKSKSCVQCRIKNCPALAESKSNYCGSCVDYPCKRLKQLDKRYRTQYGMSMIENLAKIKEIGIRSFLKEDKKRWTCITCGHTLCVHRNACPQCGEPRNAGLNWEASRAFVPHPSEIIADVAKKDYDQAKYVEEILVNDALRNLLMDQMLSNPDIMVYYHCYETIAAASFTNPLRFYSYWDRMKALLDHNNSYHRDIGLTILANLTGADKKDKTTKIIDAYLRHLQDPKFMTACCCVKNCWKIIVNKPRLTNKVLTALQHVEHTCPYPDKQKALLMGSVIEVFDSVYEVVEDKPALRTFAQSNLHSISPKTRKTAQQFLLKHE